MKRVKTGGGWPAVGYALRLARQGGPLRLLRAMRTKNACKEALVYRNETGDHAPADVDGKGGAAPHDLQAGEELSEAEQVDVAHRAR